MPALTGPAAPLRRLGLYESPDYTRDPESLTLDPAEELERRHLHHLGLTDAEAALLLQMSRMGYSGWRRSRGLPPNVEEGGDRKSHSWKIAKERRLWEAAEDLGTEAKEVLRAEREGGG